MNDQPTLGRRYAETDRWRELLLKSIPSEVIGVYLAATAAAAGIADVRMQMITLWVVWGLCTLAAPGWLYFYQQGKVPPKRHQYLVTTGSFVAWSLTVFGPFSPFVPPALASVILIVYAGLIAPGVAKLFH